MALHTNIEGVLKTYAASLGANTPAATPTDVAILTGASGILVRVTRVLLTIQATAAGILQWDLVKRIGGTQSPVDTAFAADTHVVRYDSLDAVSAVITGGLSGIYTANPASVGTIRGIYDSRTVCVLANGTLQLEWLFGNGRPAKCPVLRSGEIMAINGAGHTKLTGEKFGVSFEWTEATG